MSIFRNKNFNLSRPVGLKHSGFRAITPRRDFPQGLDNDNHSEVAKRRETQRNHDAAFSSKNVLSLAAIMFPRFSSQHNRSASRHSTVDREQFTDAEDGDQYVYYGGESRRLSHREMQLLLRQEAAAFEDSTRGVDCCPSVPEMVEPEGGQNVDGIYVELFRDGDLRQRFFELSCRKDVEGKPCRFLDRRLQNQSRCVQQYSFSYAIIQQHGPSESQTQRHHHHSPYQLSNLDYIKVRSGCSCEVMPKAKKKRNPPSKGKKGKSKRLSVDDDDK